MGCFYFSKIRNSPHFYTVVKVIVALSGNLSMVCFYFLAGGLGVFELRAAAKKYPRQDPLKINKGQSPAGTDPFILFY